MSRWVTPRTRSSRFEAECAPAELSGAPIRSPWELLCELLQPNSRGLHVMRGSSQY